MLSLLLIFVAIFVLFVLALFWAQWQKHNRPIAPLSDDGEGLGSSVVPDVTKTQPETTAPLAAEQKPTPSAGDSRLRTPVTVLPLPEAAPAGQTASQADWQAETVAAGSMGSGRIRYAESEQRDSAQVAAGGAIPGGAENPYGVPKELEGATWLRFHFHSPGQSPQNASSKATTQEQLRATIGSATPNRLKKSAPQRPAPSGRNDIPRHWQTASEHAPLMEGSSYLKAAWKLCSEIANPEASAAEGRPTMLGAPRRTSEKERILVLALWGIVVPAAVIFALLPSKSVQMRLKTQPPADFVYYQEGSAPSQQSSNATLAQAYWTCAVQSIQYQYSPEKALPADPPPQFKISAENSQESVSDNSTALRDQYWENLRKVWTQPGAWEKASVTSSSWASDLLGYLQGIVDRYTSVIRKSY